MLIETLITNVALGDPGSLYTIAIQSGRFVSIDKQHEESDRIKAKWILDAQGCLMLPGIVEPHAHLDKCYSPWPEKSSDQFSGGLRQAIDNMAQIKNSRSLDDVDKRARQGLERAISKGVCYMRSHLDLGSERDLAVIERLMDLRRDYTDKIQLEYSLLCSLDSEDQIQLAEQAFALGADAIGGAPALTEHPRQSIDQALEFAHRHQCPLDLHIDETADPDSGCLEYLAERVLDTGFSQPVTASHCCSLGFQADADRVRVIEKVRRAGVHIISLPACNLQLIGRGQSPAPRGSAPIKELLDAGVNVSAGCDNVQDPFHPWGDYEPLGTACINAGIAQLDSKSSPQTAMDLVTKNAASAMNLSEYGIQVGNKADFCLLRCTSLLQAIAERSLRTWVFFRGKPVIKQTLEQVWFDGRADKKSLINPL